MKTNHCDALPEYRLEHKDGENWVVFHDREHKGVAWVKAETLLRLASDICGGEMDTAWAKRHLQSKGYRVTWPSRFMQRLGF